MASKTPSGVVVEDNGALASEIDRLAKGEGGTVLLAPSEKPYSVKILDFKTAQIDAPITIRSLDGANPAVLDRFLATNRENLTLTDVRGCARRARAARITAASSSSSRRAAARTSRSTT